MEQVQARDEEVVQVVVVKDRKQQCCATYEYTLHAANIWNIVHDGVAITLLHFLVQVHLDGDIKLNVVIFFIWSAIQLLNFKEVCIFKLSQIVQVNKLILQMELCIAYLERYLRLYLCVNGYPLGARL